MMRSSREMSQCAPSQIGDHHGINWRVARLALGLNGLLSPDKSILCYSYQLHTIRRASIDITLKLHAHLAPGMIVLVASLHSRGYRYLTLPD